MTRHFNGSLFLCVCFKFLHFILKVFFPPERKEAEVTEMRKCFVERDLLGLQKPIFTFLPELKTNFLSADSPQHSTAHSPGRVVCSGSTGPQGAT